MLERQEIDALLISSLYGELTPSEETRLAAHLESHPTDKAALAALTSTREAVRESRILAVQLDPPQSISALLVQEAARRAPKQEGWFARLARSFMMHPAMAAAAMLVVVIGVATLVNNRKGDQFSESNAPAVSNTTAGSASGGDQTVITEPLPAAKAELKNGDTISAGSGSAAAMAGSDAFGVDLAEPSAPRGNVDTDRKLADERVRELGKAQSAKQEAAVTKSDGDDGVAKGKEKASPSAKKGVASKAPSGPYMELRTPDPAVKDLDGAPSANQGRAYDFESDLAKEQQTNAITPGPNTTPTAPNTGYARNDKNAGNGSAAPKTPPKDAVATPAQKPPSRAEVRSIDSTTATTTGTAPRAATPPTVSRNTTTAPRNTPATTQPAPPPPAKVAGAGAAPGGGGPAPARDDKPRPVAPAQADDKSPNDPQLAWAREQHTAILAQVRSGNCKGAANIAVNLANRDRAYYEQNVATDRSVKECLAYIDNAREKDAEQRAERNRATQKRATEPAKRVETKPADAKAADSVK